MYFGYPLLLTDEAREVNRGAAEAPQTRKD